MVGALCLGCPAIARGQEFFRAELKQFSWKTSSYRATILLGRYHDWKLLLGVRGQTSPKDVIFKAALPEPPTVRLWIRHEFF